MTKTKKTPKQKFKTFLKILLIIIMIIAVLCGLLAVVSCVGLKLNGSFISSLSSVEYDNQLAPTLDENGYYTFVTDDDFKIMHLTDIHIGGGFLSIKKDNMALNAVAAMVKEEKPDLVVVTGDIAYPIPFQSGTFNNKKSAELFADLMEQLGVYWCLAFGNHDTEAYSYYSREEIAEVYEGEKYEHCLFQSGDENVDGVGNYIINIKNTGGEITQSLVMLDSHSYVDNDYLGIMWKYDTIHENQIEWYEQSLLELQEQNDSVMPKSLVFFHIALPEYRDAWYEYRDNEYEDTENVQYIYGKAGEHDIVVYSSEYNYGFFDKMLELGSTQGTFCGHDHLNNFSINYKGIRLTYGYSIDYLAYTGIMKYGLQRGCTMITVSPDGSFESKLENYYQDKYTPTNEKENVLMEDYYSDEEE
ncbi:MAG: metallophosphoesterase [Clostridiales bacterium]|nr:metallophosphoesterase [Clostridiales bacterium]